MSDLIERQVAQTELMMKCERYTLARESHGMGYMEWSSDLISVADAMDAIRDLPSAQPETEERTAESVQNVPKDDLISRKAAIDAAKAHWYKPDIAGAIEQLPSAQPEKVCVAEIKVDGEKLQRCIDEAVERIKAEIKPEIIRCKDCIVHGVCRFEQGLGLDGYCSQAERRTNE